MKKKIIKTTAIFDEDGYSDDLGDGPSDRAIIIPDFLPSPAELAGVSRKSKVTLELETESLAFFKKKAKELGVPYQRMIRNLIEQYAARHK
jgi:hypothetical protein